jgi:uncharacterized protein
MSSFLSGLRRAVFAAFMAAGFISAGPGAARAQQPAAPTGPSIETIMKTPFQPTHLALANEVLKASGLHTMFENSLPNVVGALRVNVTRQRPELAKDIEECLALVEKESLNVIAEGVNGASRFLAIRLSEAELKEVQTFLTSPVGKKYVEALPQFMEQAMPYLEVWSQEAGARLSQVFQNEMAKRGHKL